MIADLTPGPDFEEFLQRADAARQGDEGLHPLCHHLLALVHGVDHVQFLQVGMPHLPVHQHAWDHADDPAAVGQHRIGDEAHEADLAAAVDQLPATLADHATDVPGGLCMGWFRARA